MTKAWLQSLGGRERHPGGVIQSALADQQPCLATDGRAHQSVVLRAGAGFQGEAKGVVSEIILAELGEERGSEQVRLREWCPC